MDTGSALDRHGTFLRQGATLLDRGSHAVHRAADEMLRASRAGLYVTSHLIEGNALPALTFLSTMGDDIAASWSSTLKGEKPWLTHFSELGRRFTAGARYENLVHTLGKEVFGAATYAGQETLLRTDQYELNYLPPRPDVPRQPVALFHVGGFIPYGDRIFRFLPEANLFDRYLERGIPVYAMELRGPKDELKNLRALTVERLIDTIDEMSQVAFDHHGGRKLIAHGYCGTGMQLLAYVAAKPKEADARFGLVSLFVAPIDGRKCMPIAELLLHLPRALISTKVAAAEMQRGYLTGIELWAGLDTSLKNIFAKTSLGRFAAGWANSAFADVTSVADLTPAQRIELAAAYWISVRNAERFPIPADLIRYFAHLFTDGVTADGACGVSYHGRALDLHTIRSETKLRVVAFFGALDKVVQEGSGRVLKEILGDRYDHIVHPNAAHVSYIMVPSQWRADAPNRLDPNPIDVLLEQTAAAAPPRARKAAPRATT